MKKKMDMSLDDMLFEHKNKAYGAYALRKEYKANLTKALFLSVLSLMLFGLSSFWVEQAIQKPGTTDIPKIYDWGDFIEPPNIKEDEPVKKEIIEAVKPKLLAIAKLPPIVEPIEDDKMEDEPIASAKEIEEAIVGTVNAKGESSTGGFDLAGTDKFGVVSVTPFEQIEPPAEPEPPSIFLSSEVMPEFTGGISKMYKWLSKNVRYPKEASRNGIEGRVIVSFVVEKDGQITGVEILKGIGFGCDEETLRVITKMPRWKPGKQNGTPVRVKYTLPLSFKITE